MGINKKNLLVTLADKNYIKQAKQLFSGVYFNAGWKGDYMLLSHNIPEKELKWFRKKGILIKKCKPVIKFKKVRYSETVVSKFYLFTTEFKKWRNIVYLDGDIIVNASLDRLIKVKGFYAAKDNLNLYKQFTMGGINKKSKNKNKKIIGKLKNNYNLRSAAFNSGVMAFSTDIIKSNNFKDLIKLCKKYGNIPYFGEQPIINLLFYKKWKKLPKPYNFFSFELIKRLDKKGSEVIIHFCHDVKPWIKKNDYYHIWKHNLKRADFIRIDKPKIAKSAMTDFQMNIEYLLSKEKIKIIIDKFLGFIGTILNKNFPKIYLIIKKHKNDTHPTC